MVGIRHIKINARDVGEIATGFAAGTPLTFSLKTLNWSAAAFEAAMTANAIVVTTSEQDLACSEFLRVNFIIYLCWFGFVSVCAALHRALETPTRRL